MTVEKIKQHMRETSFIASEDRETPTELWTFKGTGVFSKGREGVQIQTTCEACGNQLDNDNAEDLEFLAKAPEYIRYLLKQLGEDV